jgi:hypothetical protein
MPMDLSNQLFHVVTLYSINPTILNYGFIVFVMVVIFIVIGIYRFFLYSQLKHIKVLFLVFLTTTFISLPFYFPDGEIRTLVIVLPYFGIGIVIGVIGWRSRSDISKEIIYKNTQSLFTFTIPVVLGILILTSVFLTPVAGPILKHNIMNSTPAYPPPVCTQNETIFTMRVDTGIPYLEMIKNSSAIPVFSPVVNPNEFSVPNERYYLDYYFDLTDFINGNDSPIVFLGYDLNYHRSILVLAPSEVITPEYRIIQFCGEPRNQTKAQSVYRMNVSST